MDLSQNIVDAPATLSDPFFAFAFFVNAGAMLLSGFAATYYYRAPNPKHRHRSFLGILVVLFIALDTAYDFFLVSNFAMQLFKKTMTVHYWYTDRYVWATWSAAGAGALLGALARWRAVSAERAS